MAGEHLKDMSQRTPEERDAIIAKAQESRKAKAEWARNNLKLSWADDEHWVLLSKKHGYKLPVKTHKAASKFVNRFLKHFQLDKEWYQDHTGFKNGNEEARVNPMMNARAQIGFLLEQYDEDVSQ